MGLASAQRLLARLSTDASLRARFALDPAAVAVEFGLSPDEAVTLAELPITQLNVFAGSLIHKRRGEVESLLPRTFQAIGPVRFIALFRHHAEAYNPIGIKKHRDDAIAFADRIAREPTSPSWIADLARLEAMNLLAHDPSRRWTVVRLRYHPRDLAAIEGEPRRDQGRRWSSGSGSRDEADCGESFSGELCRQVKIFS